MWVRTAKEGAKYKIGMVHQHYKLVNVFTAVENIILGQNTKEIIDVKKVKSEIQNICDLYGFKINLDQKIYDEVHIITDEEAIQTAKDLARKEGIMCGISSGTKTIILTVVISSFAAIILPKEEQE